MRSFGVSPKLTPKLRTGKSQELPKYIIESIKLKRYWKRKFEKTKKLEDFEKYKHLLNFTRFQIKKLKEDKWESFLKGLKNKTPVSTKPFWQRVNKYRKKKDSNIPYMMHEGKKLVTNEDKANCFADKYKIIFSDEENPNYDSKFKRETEDFIMNRKYEELFTDKTIKFFYPAELDKVISEISSKKSLDQESVCNLMIKHFPERFKVILLKVFNHCLVNNIIPDEWKKATISMIYKKGCKKSRDNYRPISITSCIAKVFEKLVLNRIKLHLKENNIIIKNQSGFRENRQTKDNIFNITQKVLESFNRDKKVCCIFFDISAAFDKVWHVGLIFKLVKIKLPLYLINWIVTFLNNRQFRVKIGDYCTAPAACPPDEAARTRCS